MAHVAGTAYSPCFGMLPSKFTQKSRRRERVNLLDRVVAEGKQIYRKRLGFDGQR